MRRVTVGFAIIGLLLLPRYLEAFPSLEHFTMRRSADLSTYLTLMGFKIGAVFFLLVPLIPRRYFSSRFVWAGVCITFALLAVIPLINVFVDWPVMRISSEVSGSPFIHSLGYYFDFAFVLCEIFVMALFSLQLFNEAPSFRNVGADKRF